MTHDQATLMSAGFGTAATPAGLPRLDRGRHPGPGRGACLMEATAHLAGEPYSDRPACVHPVLAALARVVNDAVSDQTRQALRPLAARLIGTADVSTEVTGRLVALCCQHAQPVALPIWAPRLCRDLRRLHRGRPLPLRRAVGTATRAAASLALADPQLRDRLLVDLLTDALTLAESPHLRLAEMNSRVPSASVQSRSSVACAVSKARATGTGLPAPGAASTTGQPARP
jgi:hypothetical protein